MLGYVGTHGLAHGLETLLDAMVRLREDPAGDRYRLLLLGDGARKAALMELARQRGQSEVLFIDSVPKDEVARYWSLLDVSIIHLKNTALFSSVIPSKLFECMGMGIPVLHGVPGESADIVLTEGVGLIFPPEDVEGLVDGVRRMAGDPAFMARCRASGLTAARRYDRSTLALRMLEGLKQAERSPMRPYRLTTCLESPLTMQSVHRLPCKPSTGFEIKNHRNMLGLGIEFIQDSPSSF